MGEKYAALFILYNPSNEELLNIVKVSSFYDIIYVYNNSESKEGYEKILTSTKIQYFGSGKNNGLSIAYNTILKQAFDDEVSWLSLYDQDSIVSESMILHMIRFSQNIDDENIACLAPYIQYGNEKIDDLETREISWTINSGKMLNVKNILKKNIHYDENLFLDRVDKDFCKQIELAGMKIIQVSGAVLKQKLGENYNGYSVHSPIRNYYIQKNRLYYNYKYYGTFIGTIISLAQTFNHFIYILRIGIDIKENLRMIRKGIGDYIQNKMGKMV